MGFIYSIIQLYTAICPPNQRIDPQIPGGCRDVIESQLGHRMAEDDVAESMDLLIKGEIQITEPRDSQTRTQASG